MVQKLYDVRAWTFLDTESQMDFPADKGRNVVLHVNAPHKTHLVLVNPDGEPKFLAQVEGLDVVEFYYVGDFSLAVDGEAVFIRTAEGAKTHIENMGEATFTKIAERRRVSPEMALMQRAMRENSLRMEQALLAQEERFRNELARATEQPSTQAVPAAQPDAVAEPAVEPAVEPASGA